MFVTYQSFSLYLNVLFPGTVLQKAYVKWLETLL